MRRIQPLQGKERERERVRLVFAGIGTADKWENFPGAFSTRSRQKQPLATLRFPKGNAPFRFRAAALFSRGGSKLPLYFGKLNRVCHVGLRP